jgi:hypothetical protein
MSAQFCFLSTFNVAIRRVPVYLIFPENMNYKAVSGIISLPYNLHSEFLATIINNRRLKFCNLGRDKTKSLKYE